jgi:hypothetical protein
LSRVAPQADDWFGDLSHPPLGGLSVAAARAEQPRGREWTAWPRLSERGESPSPGFCCRRCSFCLEPTAPPRTTALSIALSLIVRCESPPGADRCLTRLDGEARDPQEDVALLAHGTGWMSRYQRDRYFEYGVLDRA